MALWLLRPTVAPPEMLTALTAGPVLVELAMVLDWVLQDQISAGTGTYIAPLYHT